MLLASTSSSVIAVQLAFLQAMIPPRLEILRINRMEALKNIWPAACGSSEAPCSLRRIQVIGCDNLVNMFPRNPMPFLHHLESIYVSYCPSMEVLFEFDEVGCIIGDHEIKYEASPSNLRWIDVSNSEKLTEVWRLKGGGGVNMNHPHDHDHHLIICGCFQVDHVDGVSCESMCDDVDKPPLRFRYLLHQPWIFG